MDPVECWNDILSFLEDGETRCAAHLADELLGWLRNGGFAPWLLLKSREAPFDLDRLVVTTVCERLAQHKNTKAS